MKRGVWLRAALVLALVGGALALLVANFPRRRSGPHPESLAMARAAIDAFAASPALEIRSVDEVRNAIAREAPVGGASLPAELRDSFATAFAEHLLMRAEGTADAHIAWAERNGYRIKPEFERANLGEADRKFFLEQTGQQSLPVDYSTIDYFRMNHAFNVATGGDQDDPGAIALGKEGVRVYYYWSTDPRGIDINIPLDLVPLESNRYGARTIGSVKIWEPIASYSNVLAKHGGVACAVIYMGFEGKSGLWFPCKMTWHFDPDSKRWFLNEMIYTNTWDVRTGPIL